MPVELLSVDDLVKVAQKALECRVKRVTRDGKAKIKVRTKRYLYTYKVDPSQLNDVLSKLNCKKVVDVDQEIAEAKKRRAEERRKAKEEKAKAQQAAATQEAQPAAAGGTQEAQASQGQQVQAQPAEEKKEGSPQQ
ncbi:hypothetical protein ASAC_0474 [Acidilobus saccharovorans 345-15]|uniref:50S ribosomal protein L38e n=1 Tax=Acidilobus saccharovorans (strain DSM 16705 / JCM 18335 / VKM B-2471 / 345-15) TaxID=666510 RepID=D9Q0P3_ACIS3|nr:hypothetical protein [Acidilobus saccharovorans]ADL18881.1 hypothetical protein ASAC_0474 [Acidilobus saccharovorans 345-15]